MALKFESRFGKVIEEYRPAYPPKLCERILAAVPPDQRERAMDLGAGTGQTTQALASHFREMIAAEPDPAMAAELAKLIAARRE